MREFIKTKPWANSIFLFALLKNQNLDFVLKKNRMKQFEIHLLNQCFCFYFFKINTIISYLMDIKFLSTTHYNSLCLKIKFCIFLSTENFLLSFFVYFEFLNFNVKPRFYFFVCVLDLIKNIKEFKKQKQLLSC
jgi:hypothetical protein